MTLKKAIDISVAMETAATGAVEIQHSHSEAHVHKLHARRKPQPRQKKQSTPTCYRCDGQVHYANECRFKEAICHECKKGNTLRRHAKERRYQIPGSYTYPGITKMMNPIVTAYIV